MIYAAVYHCSSPPPGAEQQQDGLEKTATITLKKECNNFGFTISGQSFLLFLLLLLFHHLPAGGRMDGHPITVSNVTVNSEVFRQGQGQP